MHPLELAAEEDAPATAEALDDIRRTLGPEAAGSDYRTLALWPEYLRHAWEQLKPLALTPPYEAATAALRAQARRLASSLPHRIDVPVGEGQGERDRALGEVVDRFEQVLPPLCLNVALLELERLAPEVARTSPFPARFHVPPPGGSS
jgi:hypothetical protein